MHKLQFDLALLPAKHRDPLTAPLFRRPQHRVTPAENELLTLRCKGITQWSPLGPAAKRVDRNCLGAWVEVNERFVRELIPASAMISCAIQAGGELQFDGAVSSRAVTSASGILPGVLERKREKNCSDRARQAVRNSARLTSPKVGNAYGQRQRAQCAA